MSFEDLYFNGKPKFVYVTASAFTTKKSFTKYTPGFRSSVSFRGLFMMTGGAIWGSVCYNDKGYCFRLSLVHLTLCHCRETPFYLHAETSLNDVLLGNIQYSGESKFPHNIREGFQGYRDLLI